MKLVVNGREIEIDVDPEMPLLWALRDVLNLTGTKYGCGIAQCGACTVHLDGQPIRSCITPVSAAEGQQVTTIEGLSGPVADAVRTAWVGVEVPQCGYCQSGQIMSAVALLNDNKAPSRDDVDAAMAGNICRCATYQRIREGIAAAAKTLEA